MDRAELKQRIIALLIEIAPDVEPNQVPDNEDLREALELDSMDFLRLLTAINQQIGVSIPESDYSKVLTLNEMVSYLEAKI